MLGGAGYKLITVVGAGRDSKSCACSILSKKNIRFDYKDLRKLSQEERTKYLGISIDNKIPFPIVEECGQYMSILDYLGK